MKTLTEESETSGEPAMTDLSRDVPMFDPGAYFDEWLRAVKDARPSDLSATEPAENSSPTISLKSFAGSDCKLSFEGLLQFDGDFAGNIRSTEGTLLISEQGHVEADIGVPLALINGHVKGNINASEGVELGSQARVIGNIHTPSLSIRLGAVFEGECLVAGSAVSPAASFDEENRWADTTAEDLLETSPIRRLI